MRGKPHEKRNSLPCEVEFPPKVTVSRRRGIGVVVVVPPFTGDDEPDERVVAAVVRGRVIAIAPNMVTGLTDQAVCQTTTVRCAPPRSQGRSRIASLLLSYRPTP